MTITEIIREKLSQIDGTLYRVAKDCGVGWATIKRFLDGSGLRSDQLDKIADYLGMTVTTKEPSKTIKAKKK